MVKCTAELPPSVEHFPHIPQCLLSVVGALVTLVTVVKATLTEIPGKRLVIVALGILCPRIERRTGAPVERHDARLAGAILLLRVNPSDPVNLLLLVCMRLISARTASRVNGDLCPLLMFGKT